MLRLIPECYELGLRKVHDESDGFQVVTYDLPFIQLVDSCFLEKGGYQVGRCLSLETFTHLHNSAKSWVDSMEIRSRRQLRCLRVEIEQAETDVSRITEVFGDLK